MYDYSPVRENDIVLKFVMVSVLFFSIGAVQFILNNLKHYLYGSPINKFKDLCTFANISIIMLDEHSHGYYLHGKVPWSTSDIPLDWLQTELNSEADGKPGRDRRGLKNAKVPAGNSYEVQSF